MPSSHRVRRVVAIGGGHGLSRTLAALCLLDDVEVTAVVAMADDGGSSGRLRRDLGVVPPGDLRKALSSLVPDAEIARWVEHRFPAGELAGHSLGNLMLIGLHRTLGGELVEALDRLGQMLGARGRVLPSTTDAVSLIADGTDGEVRGQATITRTSGHRRVRLDPPGATATPQAVQAIEAADLVLLGPGSLFTSILPNLLVPEITKALIVTGAPVALLSTRAAGRARGHGHGAPSRRPRGPPAGSSVGRPGHPHGPRTGRAGTSAGGPRRPPPRRPDGGDRPARRRRTTRSHWPR